MYIIYIKKTISCYPQVSSTSPGLDSNTMSDGEEQPDSMTGDDHDTPTDLKPPPVGDTDHGRPELSPEDKASQRAESVGSDESDDKPMVDGVSSNVATPLQNMANMDAKLERDTSEGGGVLHGELKKEDLGSSDKDGDSDERDGSEDGTTPSRDPVQGEGRDMAPEATVHSSKQPAGAVGVSPGVLGNIAPPNVTVSPGMHPARQYRQHQQFSPSVQAYPVMVAGSPGSAQQLTPSPRRPGGQSSGRGGGPEGGSPMAAFSPSGSGRYASSPLAHAATPMVTPPVAATHNYNSSGQPGGFPPNMASPGNPQGGPGNHYPPPQPVDQQQRSMVPIQSQQFEQQQQHQQQQAVNYNQYPSHPNYQYNQYHDSQQPQQQYYPMNTPGYGHGGYHHSNGNYGHYNQYVGSNNPDYMAYSQQQQQQQGGYSQEDYGFLQQQGSQGPPAASSQQEYSMDSRGGAGPGQGAACDNFTPDDQYPVTGGFSGGTGGFASQEEFITTDFNQPNPYFTMS